MRAGADPRAYEKFYRGKTMTDQSPITFRRHDQALHARAISAYRTRLMRRRMAGAGCGIFLAVLLGAAVLGPREELQQTGYTTGSRTDESVGEADNGEKKNALAPPVYATTPTPIVARELNDEELLAIFPEGSCFIAEVNGKKTLVFSDPAARARFFN